MAGANPASQWGVGWGSQLGQIAGSSRDVNKQATSTDMNLCLAGQGAEVIGAARKCPPGKTCQLGKQRT